MRPAWTALRSGFRTAVVRRDFEPPFRSLGLIRAADLPAPEISDRARPFRPPGGRGDLARVPAGDLGEAVVRPYRRGGLAARVATSRYLLGDRAFRELALTLRLLRAGVPAVEPLAAVQSACRPGYRAALVTRFVPDAAPAPGVLAAGPRGDGGPAGRSADDGRGSGETGARRPEARHALRRMGRAVRRLHDAGGHHPDLNAHNFLLPDDPERPAVLLDFDRARTLPPPLPGPLARWSLRRLRRSLAKLGLEAALEAWDAFEEGYAGTPGAGG
jgi:3-deoxy-D-manno-octulosonic acid kinase